MSAMLFFIQCMAVLYMAMLYGYIMNTINGGVQNICVLVAWDHL